MRLEELVRDISVELVVERSVRIYGKGNIRAVRLVFWWEWEGFWWVEGVEEDE